MKRLCLISYLLLFPSLVFGATAFEGVNRFTVVEQKAKGMWYVSTSAALTDHGAATVGTLAWIKTQIGTTHTWVDLPPATYTISTNFDTGAYLHLRIQPGAVIARGGSATLTISASVEAPMTQWLSGWSAGLTFGSAVEQVEVVWFGATKAGLEAALASVPTTSHKTVYLPPGNLDLGAGTVTFIGGVDLLGYGTGDLNAKSIGSRLYNGTIQIGDGAATKAFRLAHFALEGRNNVTPDTGAAAIAKGLILGKWDDVSQAYYGQFEDLLVSGFSQAGIELRFASECTFVNVRSKNNAGRGLWSDDATQGGLDRTFSTQVKFLACTFDYNGTNSSSYREGVYLQSGSGIYFGPGCTMQGNKGEGFRLSTDMGYRVDNIVTDTVWIEDNLRDPTLTSNYQVNIDSTTPGSQYVGKVTMRNTSWGAPDHDVWNGSAGNRNLLALCKSFVSEGSNSDRLIGSMTLPANVVQAYRASLLGEPITHWKIDPSTRVETPVAGYKWASNSPTSTSSLTYADLFGGALTAPKTFTVQADAWTNADVDVDPVAGNMGGFLTGLRIKAAGSKTSGGSAAAPTLKFDLGSATLAEVTMSATAGDWTAEIEVILPRDHGTFTQVVTKVDQGTAIISRTAAKVTTAPTTAQKVTVQGKVGHTDDAINLRFLCVERF
jgi:hypothetical protein